MQCGQLVLYSPFFMLMAKKPQKPSIVCPKCGHKSPMDVYPGIAWDVLICDLCDHRWLSRPMDDLAFEHRDAAAGHLLGITP